MCIGYWNSFVYCIVKCTRILLDIYKIFCYYYVMFNDKIYVNVYILNYTKCACEKRKVDELHSIRNILLALIITATSRLWVHLFWMHHAIIYAGIVGSSIDI